MFMGEFNHSLDVKGRLIVPAKFREGLGNHFVITKGMDRCLFAYPSQEWLKIEAKINSLPFTKSDARAFSRFFFSGAAECELDKQSRILIPQNLREYASLEKETVLTGVSQRVEIWNPKMWQDYCQKAEEGYAEISEKMEFDF